MSFDGWWLLILVKYRASCRGYSIYLHFQSIDGTFNLNVQMYFVLSMLVINSSPYERGGWVVDISVSLITFDSNAFKWSTFVSMLGKGSK